MLGGQPCILRSSHPADEHRVARYMHHCARQRYSGAAVTGHAGSAAALFSPYHCAEHRAACAVASWRDGARAVLEPEVGRLARLGLEGAQGVRRWGALQPGVCGIANLRLKLACRPASPVLHAGRAPARCAPAAGRAGRGTCLQRLDEAQRRPRGAGMSAVGQSRVRLLAWGGLEAPGCRLSLTPRLLDTAQRCSHRRGQRSNPVTVVHARGRCAVEPRVRHLAGRSP